LKKCGQCGFLNGNNILYCSECNNKLGEPLTREEEEEVLLKQKKHIIQEEIYIKGFVITLTDKIAAGIAVLGIIASAALIGDQWFTENECCFISILFFVLCVLVSLSANFFWKLRFVLYRDFYLEPSDFALGLRKVFIYIFLLIGYFLIVKAI